MCYQLSDKERCVTIHLASLIAKARNQVNKKNVHVWLQFLNSKKINLEINLPKRTEIKGQDCIMHQSICPATKTTAKVKNYLS